CIDRRQCVMSSFVLQVGSSVRRVGYCPRLCCGWGYTQSVRPQLHLTGSRRSHQEHSDEYESENRAERRDESLVHLSLLLEWYIAQFSIENLLGKFHALVFEYLCILFDDAVQRHPDLPGPRENFGIFDGGFVVQVI